MPNYAKTSVVFDPMVIGNYCQSVDELTDSKELSIQQANIAPLFPPNVVVRERSAAGDAADLLPDEAKYMARAHPKRINEFAAGRACARAALAALGIRDFALQVAADRQPVWPVGFVGSITHTTGFCAAAVAASSSLQAIGLDSEVVGSPTLDIWPTICRDEELAWVESLAAAVRPSAVTLLFSVKEAFYKCQYPLVGEWLDFHDLRVDVRDWGATAGSFLVRASRSLRIARYVELPAVGRYAFHEQFVSAGIVVAAEARAVQ